MFSLFKSVFFGRNKNERPDEFSNNDLSFSILRNYRSRMQGINEEGCHEAADHIQAEMRSLEEALRYVDADKRYDLISASLRRIDQELGR